MKILLVTAHPRSDSLTYAVAKAFTEAAKKNGHEIEVADLMAEAFDPVLREPDEPDWANPNKVYSTAVQNEMARIERNEATVMVFPVWWWSMPALLKGWIDRVWNNGWAYGDKKYPRRASNFFTAPLKARPILKLYSLGRANWVLNSRLSVLGA